MARLDYNGGKFPTLPGSYNSPVYRPCTGGQDNPATASYIDFLLYRIVDYLMCWYRVSHQYSDTTSTRTPTSTLRVYRRNFMLNMLRKYTYYITNYYAPITHGRIKLNI